MMDGVCSKGLAFIMFHRQSRIENRDGCFKTLNNFKMLLWLSSVRLSHELHRVDRVNVTSLLVVAVFFFSQGKTNDNLPLR
jgi:hypothetical protein